MFPVIVVFEIAYLRATIVESKVPFRRKKAESLGQSEVICLKCEKLQRLQVKPSKAHHCSQCSGCIKHMDHHCGFLMNCVAEDNMKDFLLLLLSGSVLLTGLGLFLFLVLKRQYALVQDSDRFVIKLLLFLVALNGEFLIAGGVMLCLGLFFSTVGNLLSNSTVIENLKKSSTYDEAWIIMKLRETFGSFHFALLPLKKSSKWEGFNHRKTTGDPEPNLLIVESDPETGSHPETSLIEIEDPAEQKEL